MRSLCLILAALICSGLYGQFPAPTSFRFSYEYILLGEWGVCNDTSISGPAYCSHFNWSPPDTAQTGAKLEYYTIYQDDSPIKSVMDTFYTVTAGFIGKLYVTAVYSGPEGESDSSNAVYNADLPISSAENTGPENSSPLHLTRGKSLVVPGHADLLSLKIYDVTGREVRSLSPVAYTVNLAGLRPGLYLIRTETGTGRIRVQKILLE